jgi:enoyl-CoA hydratase/carnithine racemase
METTVNDPEPDTASEMLVETSGDVLTLTFNRPEVMNALDGAMLERAAEAVETTEARVVVVTGAGSAFSAGADLRRLERGGTHENGNRLVRAIVATPRPVVASVNGPAAGIAMSVALAADLTVAHESAYFLQAFVNIGLLPDGGATELLAASVGRARANRLSLLGERLPAADAAAMGLIDRCCGDDHAEQVQALVEKLASGPTRAYAATKQAINANTLSRLDETLERELRLQRELAETADSLEGIQAFIDKREPRFEGR